VVKPIVCKDKDHFTRVFNTLGVDRGNGTRPEGVVVRDPNAWYYKSDSFYTKKVTK
jgi:hypothetical protein